MENGPTWLTYDDVLLMPQYSTINHRDEIDLSVKLFDNVYNHPIILANMVSIATKELYSSIKSSKPLFIYHRFTKNKNILDFYLKNKETFSSLGSFSKENVDLFHLLVNHGQNKFCIDVAHGFHDLVFKMIDYIKSFNSKIYLIVGNVCSGPAAVNLKLAGADAIKVGVGPGSICTTRIMTGNGAPQLTALEQVRSFCGDKYPIIADGGIKSSGDIVKALCFADMVMVGNLFAGSYESKGHLIRKDDKFYKIYDGSSTLKNRYIEGIKGLVEYSKKSASTILNELLDGIRSGLSYQGCNKLSDFRSFKPYENFIRITNNGLIESNSHNVTKR